MTLTLKLGLMSLCTPYTLEVVIWGGGGVKSEQDKVAHRKRKYGPKLDLKEHQIF